MTTEADTEHLELLRIKAQGSMRTVSMEKHLAQALGETGRTRVEIRRTWIDGTPYGHASELAKWLEGVGADNVDLIIDHEAGTIARLSTFGTRTGLAARRDGAERLTLEGASDSASDVMAATLNQISERGEALYREHHQAHGERNAMGQFVVVDVRTGAGWTDPDSAEVLIRARENAPNGVFHLIRIGDRGTFHAYASAAA